MTDLVAGTVRDWMTRSPVIVAPTTPIAEVARRMTVEGIVMAEDPVTVSPEAPLTEAARAMLERKIGALPVVDDDRPVGILTKSDALEALLACVERR